MRSHHLLLLLLLVTEALHVRVLLHMLYLLLHGHIHFHLGHLGLIEIRVVDHIHRHTPLVMLRLHLRQHSLSHDGLLLHLRTTSHSTEVHLRILLLEHMLLRAKVCHSHRVAGHMARRRSAGTLRHARDHGTLGDLRRRDSRMHALHHAGTWMASHMSAWVLHTSHGMCRTSHSWMTRSHAGRESRLRHHISLLSKRRRISEDRCLV